MFYISNRSYDMILKNYVPLRRCALSTSRPPCTSLFSDFLNPQSIYIYTVNIANQDPEGHYYTQTTDTHKRKMGQNISSLTEGEGACAHSCVVRRTCVDLCDCMCVWGFFFVRSNQMYHGLVTLRASGASLDTASNNQPSI